MTVLFPDAPTVEVDFDAHVLRPLRSSVPAPVRTWDGRVSSPVAAGDFVNLVDSQRGFVGGGNVVQVFDDRVRVVEGWWLAES